MAISIPREMRPRCAENHRRARADDRARRDPQSLAVPTKSGSYQRGEAVFIPRGLEVLDYVRALYEAVCSPDVCESAQVAENEKIHELSRRGR